MALEHSSATPPTHAIDFEAVGSTYFQERELKKGAAGWVLLVAPAELAPAPWWNPATRWWKR